MREIIFRGKRVDNGEWVDGSLWLYGEDAYIDGALDFSEDFWIKVDPATVGQYTGLTDKNDKRIFEGDIIKCHTGLTLEVKFGQHTDDEYGSVANGWYVVGHETSLSLECEWGGHEIIGNIHDNPELLNGGANDG